MTGYQVDFTERWSFSIEADSDDEAHEKAREAVKHVSTDVSTDKCLNLLQRKIVDVRQHLKRTMTDIEFFEASWGEPPAPGVWPLAPDTDAGESIAETIARLQVEPATAATPAEVIAETIALLRAGKIKFNGDRQPFLKLV